MSPVAERLVRALEGLTPFAEAIVRRQAEQLGFTLESVPDTAASALTQRVLVAARVYLEPTAYARVEQSVRAPARA